MENKQSTSITIFSRKDAREMIKSGFEMVDIRAHNTNADITVFYFKRTDEALEYIKEHFHMHI